MKIRSHQDFPSVLERDDGHSATNSNVIALNKKAKVRPGTGCESPEGE